MKIIENKYSNNTFEKEMNIGMHVNYKKYWNTRIGEIFKK